MAIISASVTQGAELKTSDQSTTTFVADQVMFTLGDVNITQRQAITGVVCFLAAWALKD